MEDINPEAVGLILREQKEVFRFMVVYHRWMDVILSLIRR
jgi:hypothetical protein